MSSSTSQQSTSSQSQQESKLRFDIHIKRPHEKQRLFIDSPAKRKIIRAGRRGGKTTGMAIYAAMMFMKGRRVLYAVPTSDQIKKFWFEVVKFLTPAIDSGALYKNETEHIIEQKGTLRRIRAKTAWNADTLRGDYADELILDEWQLMDESAWEDVGAPMLIDNNGNAVFIYTPPSLESASVTKAKDPQHAAKMYIKAMNDTTGRWAAFHFSSFDNPHLSAQGLAEVTKDMTQASLRREIYAEDPKEVPGALWKQELLDKTRVQPNQVPANLEMVLVGVDPTGSSTTEAGIVATASGPAPKGWFERPEHLGKKHGYVIADRSMLAPTSRAWAQQAVDLFFDVKADWLLGERNYGGDMVESTIRSADGGDKVTYQDANATRGKVVRAQPVAAAFEAELFHIVGEMPELESEMTSYVPGNPSPNRMDAMVWGALRIVEGMEILGLVSFLQTMGSDNKLLTQVMGGGAVAPQASDKERCPQCQCVTLKVDADQTRHCAECGYHLDGPEEVRLGGCPKCHERLIQKIGGGGNRCQNCGHQWNDGAENKKAYFINRNQALAGEGMRRR